MNVITAAALTLAYFLFTASAAMASDPNRLVTGLAQSGSATPTGLLLFPILLTLLVLWRRGNALFVRRRLAGTEKLFDRLTSLVEGDAMTEAMALVGRRPKYVATPVLRSALARAHQPMAVLERGVTMAKEEALQKLQQGRVLSFGLTLVWGWAALAFASWGSREVSIGIAVLFVLAMFLVIALEIRQIELASDVRHAAIRVVDLLEYRFLAETDVVVQAPRLQAAGHETVKAAMPAYEEVLDLTPEN